MKNTVEIPLVNIRDLVLYPGVEQSLYIGRAMTITAIRRAANQKGRRILAVTQKRVQDLKPLSMRDMFKMGTICTIKQCVLLADGTMKVLVRAEKRAMVLRVFERDSIRYASARLMGDVVQPVRLPEKERRELLELLVRWNPEVAVRDDNEKFIEIHKERNGKKFFKALLGLIGSPRNSVFVRSKGGQNKPMPRHSSFINDGMRRRQAILQENSPSQRAKAIRNVILKELSAK